MTAVWRAGVCKSKIRANLLNLVRYCEVNGDIECSIMVELDHYEIIDTSKIPARLTASSPKRIRAFFAELSRCLSPLHPTHQRLNKMAALAASTSSFIAAKAFAAPKAQRATVARALKVEAAEAATVSAHQAKREPNFRSGHSVYSHEHARGPRRGPPTPPGRCARTRPSRSLRMFAIVRYRGILSCTLPAHAPGCCSAHTPLWSLFTTTRVNKRRSGNLTNRSCTDV